MRKMVGQARSRRSSGECSAEKGKGIGMTRKEMKMKARIIAMERLLKEIRETVSKTDLMDRQALVRAIGGIEYASSEDTIEEIYRFEYSHMQRIESEKNGRQNGKLVKRKRTDELSWKGAGSFYIMNGYKCDKCGRKVYVDPGEPRICDTCVQKIRIRQQETVNHYERWKKVCRENVIAS